MHFDLADGAVYLSIGIGSGTEYSREDLCGIGVVRFDADEVLRHALPDLGYDRQILFSHFDTTLPLWLLAFLCLAWPVTSFIVSRRRRRTRGFEVEPKPESAVSTADS